MLHTSKCSCGEEYRSLISPAPAITLCPLCGSTFCLACERSRSIVCEECGRQVCASHEVPSYSGAFCGRGCKMEHFRKVRELETAHRLPIA